MSFESTINTFDAPAYTLFTASRYLRVKYTTLKYWVRGRGLVRPLIHVADFKTPALSFANLLECHVLNAILTKHSVKLPEVRSAIETIEKLFPASHPLLEHEFRSNGLHLIIDTLGRDGMVNASKGGQLAFREIVETYYERILWKDDAAKLYPFVARADASEPRIISITPTIAFGRSVIDGTGISTAVIASRFTARESIQSLADEYGRTSAEIEEAIRWEAGEPAAA